LEEAANHEVLLPDTKGLELPTVSGEGTFFSIQALRGVAALLVVALHTTQTMNHHFPGISGPGFSGGAGVDIFFVISGFVMTMSSRTLLRSMHPMRTFLWKRIRRVVPMYWLATTVKLGLLMAVPAAGGLLAQGAWHVAASYLFIPSIGAKGEVLPILIVGWTLNYEMLFYLIVATALGMRLRMVPFVSAVILLLSLIGFVFADRLPVALSLVSPILMEFLYGVLIAQLTARLHARRSSQKIFCYAAIVLAFAVIELSPDENVLRTRILVWGLAALAMVTAAIALEADLGRWIPRWMLELGDSSYSLYLTHTMTLAGIGSLLSHFRGLDRSGYAVEWVFAAALCLLVGELVYRWVELPITHRMKGKKTAVAHA
jgi:peptidoglycan/LPS O-acetylase OafA/YrhL